MKEVHQCKMARAKELKAEIWFSGDLDLWYLTINEDYDHDFPIDYCPFCGKELL